MRHSKTLSAALTLLLAGAAWAATVQDVAGDAQSLRDQYADLSNRVDACEGGSCPEASRLGEEFVTLHGKLEQVHEERAALPASCNCASLDELIATVDGIDEAVGLTIDNFDEVN